MPKITYVIPISGRDHDDNLMFVVRKAIVEGDEVIVVSQGEEEPFNRSKLLNRGAKAAAEIVAYCDADCFMLKEDIDRVREAFISGVKVLLPKHKCVLLSRENSRFIREDGINTNYLVGPTNSSTRSGGMCFVSTDMSLLWPEQFIGWGGEDDAFDYIAQRLNNVRIAIGGYTMYHLWHKRGIRDEELYRANVARLKELKGKGHL